MYTGIGNADSLGLKLELINLIDFDSSFLRNLPE